MKMAQVVRSILASREEVAAGEERQAARELRTTAVAQLLPRERALVSGVLRSVVLRPAAQVQAVEAELYDGSGSLDLIWLGRRKIAGIEPGRRILVEGLVGQVRGERRMFNPRYELLPRGTDDIEGTRNG